MLTLPLANRLDRPLRMAVAWGLVSLAVAVALALAVGGAAWIVAGVRSLFTDADVTWPGGLVRNVGAAAAPFVIASSTWAAAFLSTERMPAGRAVLATALGVLVLVVLARVESPAVLFAAGAGAWSLAIPFERWGRFVCRLAAVAAVAVVAHVILQGLVAGNPLWPWAAIVAASLPVAAVVLWPADRVWVAVSVRQNPKRDERRQQNRSVPADQSVPALGEETGAKRHRNHEDERGTS